jgi:hypothetical protein
MVLQQGTVLVKSLPVCGVGPDLMPCEVMQELCVDYCRSHFLLFYHGRALAPVGKLSDKTRATSNPGFAYGAIEAM